MPIRNPLHPGKVVYEIIIEGANLTVTEAAQQLGINRATLSRLLNGHAGISPDMALRLSKLLPNTDMVMWLNLQCDYETSGWPKNAVLKFTLAIKNRFYSL